MTGSLKGQLAQYFATPKLFLGPMAGVSDRAMRQISLEAGVDMTYSEMVSSKGLAYANDKTRRLLTLADNEKRIVVQLFGNDPEIMAHQSQWLEYVLGDQLFFIDINMGCPAPKVSKKGDGGALMKTPELAAQIVNRIKESVTCPVGVKCRRGFEEGNQTAVSFASLMERAGADLLCIHGRYVMQFYRGRASWDVIAEVKEVLSIPVIGNGDIKSGADALHMLKETNCDALMIARGACGNPWLLSHVKSLLNNLVEGDCSDIDDISSLPTPTERIEMARKHTHLLAYYDERALVRMRRHAMYYITGLPGASAARARINECSSEEDFEQVFQELLQRTKEYDNAS